MTDPPSPTPGWYVDPEDRDGERWWNGTAWSDHRRGPTAGYGDPTASPGSSPSAGSSSGLGRLSERVNVPATAGLLVSLSTFFVPLMGVNGIVGAILGGMGLREARRRRLAGFPNTGRGFAIAAIITGILLTLLLWAATALFIWFVLWASTLPFEA